MAYGSKIGVDPAIPRLGTARSSRPIVFLSGFLGHNAHQTCNIYQGRPFFCRVEPNIFDAFFGVPCSRFDKEACSACVGTIEMVYGEDSTELSNFKRVIREESNKQEASKYEEKLLDT